MRILVYDIRPGEEEIVKKFGKDNNVKIDMTDETLGLDNIQKLSNYDGISTHSIRDGHNPDLYSKLHQIGIKQLAIRHTGFEQVNLKSAKQNGIIVTNVPGYSPRSVSEMTLTHVMYLLRNFGVAEHNAKHNNYQLNGLEAQEIHNLTVGVIGAGRIGSSVVEIFHSLGANVLVNDPIKHDEIIKIANYVDLDDLLKNSNIITVHTPLDESTHNLINKNSFKQMPNNAIFINAARGGIVDTQALINALNQKEIAAAGLDTIVNEEGTFHYNLSNQKPQNSELNQLLNMPNVSITPHVAFYTDASVKNMVNVSLSDTLKALKGEKTGHQVN